MSWQGYEQILAHHEPRVLSFHHIFLLPHQVVVGQYLGLDELDLLLTRRKDRLLNLFDQGGRSRLLGYLFQQVNVNLPYHRHIEDGAGCAQQLGACHHGLWCGLLNQERVIVGYQISDRSVAMCYQLMSAVTGLLLVLNL